jgi:hypothetical protein
VGRRGRLGLRVGAHEAGRQEHDARATKHTLR